MRGYEELARAMVEDERLAREDHAPGTVVTRRGLRCLVVASDGAACTVLAGSQVHEVHGTRIALMHAGRPRPADDEAPWTDRMPAVRDAMVAIAFRRPRGGALELRVLKGREA